MRVLNNIIYKVQSIMYIRDIKVVMTRCQMQVQTRANLQCMMQFGEFNSLRYISVNRRSGGIWGFCGEKVGVQFQGLFRYIFCCFVLGIIIHFLFSFFFCDDEEE